MLRPLNPMQRLMRCFRELHPYNAIEVAEVEGEPEVAALAAAARAFLVEHSLAAGAPEVPLERLEGIPLEEALTREMNRPFPDGPGFPLRLFVLRSGGASHVGFVVDHAALDGRSLAALARRVLDRVHGEATGVGPLTGAGPSYLRAFGARAAPRPFRSIGRLLELRTAFTPCLPSSAGDLAVDVELLDRPGLLARLATASAERGVTIGAVLAGALAGALDAPTREARTGRRRDLSIGIVADLTRLARRPWDEEPLGVHLGYDTALFRDGRLRPPERGALASLGEIWLAQALWPLVSVAERPRFHARQLVLSAGLSNLALPAAWFPGGGRVRAWRSVSPCGPVAPLVLRVTTAGREATASLTWRRAGYAPETRAAIRAGLIERLR